MMRRLQRVPKVDDKNMMVVFKDWKLFLPRTDDDRNESLSQRYAALGEGLFRRFQAFQENWHPLAGFSLSRDARHSQRQFMQIDLWKATFVRE